MEMQWSGQILMHCRQAMQRSMSTVSIPRLRSVFSFLYSGYCRVTFLSKRCLRVIPIPFKIPCPSWGILKTFPLKHRREHEHRARGDEQPDEADRHEYLPPKVHELVHPQAREAPADPLEGEDDQRRLYGEPQPVEVPKVQKGERRLPAAEEQGGGNRRDKRHRGELGGLDQTPRHPRVLDHEPADDLALPLRKVEGHPPGLRNPRDVESYEHRQLWQEVPVPEPSALGFDHVLEREAPRE